MVLKIVEKNGEGTGVEIKDDEGVPVLEFVNWNGGIGGNTGKYIVFAVSEKTNIDLAFLAAISKFHALYKLDFQIVALKRD